ncbi:MAG: Prophage integrase IntS [Steroidobacteraceae bacterium]|nr:Prophage integrase IntS [Steroidobacteraceae bacterium]
MLTDSQIRSAKPSDRSRKLADSRGLYLHLMPSGARYWRFDYRFNGKRKTLALGVYPDTSLVKARGRHLEAREQLADGIDPGAVKQARASDFETVARLWFDRWKASRSDRHTVYVIRRLEADVFPEIGTRPLAELSASSFREVVQKIERRGALDIAKRVLQTCGQIMRFALVNDLVNHNPVAGVKPADVLMPHKRRNYPRVDEKELPDLLRGIDCYVGGEHTRLALQLMALTFVRTSERMKMKTPHIVPLSTQAKVILNRSTEISFDREFVFPGDVNPKKPMSNNTLLFALYRMGYRGRMTGHGFRGVASTILHEQGWPHAHIELQLAHQERNAVSAAYNHALYLESRTKMMQAWADHLDKLRQKGIERERGLAA